MKFPMTLLQMFALLALILSCSQLLISDFAKKRDEKSRQIASNKILKHHIVFLIHGLKGSEKTFCDLKKILENGEIGQQIYHQGTQIHVKSLTYSTRNKKMKTTDFAHEIHRKIANYFEDNDFGPDTSYSFIVHSQGGIVGYRYVQLCIYQKKCQTDDLTTPLNLVKFISFGSPFWGAPTANQISGIDFIMNRFGSNNQVDDLSVAGLQTTQMREGVLAKTEPGGDWINPAPKSLDIYNVAGNLRERGEQLFDSLGLIVKQVLSHTDFESDVVVDVPSARGDFHYYVELPGNQDFLRGTTNLIKQYFPITYWHVPVDGAFLVGKDTYRGMICIKDNDKFKPEGHVSYEIIKSIYYQHFNIHYTKPKKLFSKHSVVANKVKQQDVARDLKMFGVQIDFLISDKLKRAPREKDIVLTMREVDEDGVAVDAKKIKVIKLKNTIRQKYHGLNASDSLGRFSYYHFGLFKKKFGLDVLNDSEPKSTYIKYQVTVAGFLMKEFVIKVSPSYTSYARLNITPFRPLSLEDQMQKRVGKSKPSASASASGKNLKDTRNIFMTAVPIYWHKKDASSTEKAHDFVTTSDRFKLPDDHIAKLNIFTMNPVTQKLQKKIVRPKNHPKDFKSINHPYLKSDENSCWQGVFRKVGQFHKGQVFARVSDKKPLAGEFFANTNYQLVNHATVKVLGRYKTKKGVDRYLLTSPLIRHRFSGLAAGALLMGLDYLKEGKGLVWANVNDVDITGKQTPCFEAEDHHPTQDSI